jgi:membrane glycosyltransferase
MDPALAKWVFVGTIGVLLAPKLLGWIALQFDAPARRGLDGASHYARSRRALPDRGGRVLQLRPKPLKIPS